MQKVLTPLDMQNNSIRNLPTPTNNDEPAIKSYVDGLLQGVRWKEQVRAATTANITLSGTQTIDGVSLIASDRCLVKNQSTASANGIYEVQAGSWVRAPDADTALEVTGMAMFVQEGTTQGNTQWVCSTDGAITLGTTSLTFSQLGAGTTYTAGTGISVSGSVISVDTTVTARKAGATIGDGTATSFNVTHNLGTTDAVVMIRESAGGNAQVLADVVFTNSNTVTVAFAVAPTTGQYRVTVIG